LDAGLKEGLLIILPFLVYFLDHLLLLEEFELPVLADGLFVLETAVADELVLVLLVAAELLLDFAQFLLLALLGLPHALLVGFELGEFVVVLLRGELVVLQQVELVAGRQHRHLADRLQVPALVALHFAELVQRTPRLLDPRLQFGQVL
jgi:hypothetical protein